MSRSALGREMGRMALHAEGIENCLGLEAWKRMAQQGRHDGGWQRGLEPQME